MDIENPGDGCDGDNADLEHHAEQEGVHQLHVGAEAQLKDGFRIRTQVEGMDQLGEAQYAEGQGLGMAQGILRITLGHQREEAHVVRVHFHPDNKRRKCRNPDNRSVQQDVPDFAVEQTFLGGAGFFLHDGRVLGVHP
ncbi:hypothetical protein D3C75_1048030 [compost metagenome]